MEIRELEWDDENVEHLARHGVNPVEVEDVCFGLHIAFVGRQARYILYGKTSDGRYLMVVLERLRRRLFRPMTGRDMTESEKKIYRRRVK